MLNPSLNPHTLQNPSSYYTTEKLVRICSDDFQELKYRPRKPDEDRSTVHFGQRKLYLSEMEFLTNITREIDTKNDKKIVVIYAGAAPGIHISSLSLMFPFVKFVLVDPAKFQVKKTSKIEIIQDFFTDKMAEDMKQEYKNYLRYFISDIRLYGPGSLSENALEEKVEEDMAAQMKWYHILQPEKSMLKFRLPYIGEHLDRKLTMDYLEGDIYFQIWPAGSSSETRLVVGKNAKMKTYNSIKYENQLFRFNQVERTLCYKHEIEAPGIDHCYDCRAEIYVFEEYNKIVDKINDLSDDEKKVKIKSVKEHIIDLNQELNARNKQITITKNQKNFNLCFTDIMYGKRFEDLCNERTFTYNKRRTYFDYQKPRNVNNLPKKVYDDVKEANRPILKRLGPTSIYRSKKDN